MFVVVFVIVPIGALFIVLSLWGLFERYSSEALPHIVTVR